MFAGLLGPDPQIETMYDGAVRSDFRLGGALFETPSTFPHILTPTMIFSPPVEKMSHGRALPSLLFSTGAWSV